MDTRITGRRFLAAASFSVAYLASINTVGCDLLERTPKVRPAPVTANYSSTLISHPTMTPTGLFASHGALTSPTTRLWQSREDPMATFRSTPAGTGLRR